MVTVKQLRRAERSGEAAGSRGEAGGAGAPDLRRGGTERLSSAAGLPLDPPDSQGP